MYNNSARSLTMVFILWMITFFNHKFYVDSHSLASRSMYITPNRSTKLFNLKNSTYKPEIDDRDNDNFGFVDGLVKVNVFGNLNKFAYYYLYIGIGTPKVKQMLIIDTGSQLVNVSCGMCTECGTHLLPNYDLYTSMTHKTVDCESEFCKNVDAKCATDNSCIFNESYSEGSHVEGKYVGDLISFDTSKDSTDLVSFFNYIGCVNKESKLIKSQITNGILGLSKSQKPTLINDEYFENQSFIEKYLTDHFRPKSKIFSLCLSENGGVMTLGGIDQDLNLMVKNKAQMVWVPMVKSEFYIIRVFDALFQDTKIEYNNKKFVLDTGTTISTFEPKLYNQIHKLFVDICKEITVLSQKKKTSNKCTVDRKTGKICFSDISKLPSIVLAFENGSKFEWNSDSYMIDRTNKKTVNDYNWWCIGFEKSKTNENILGATFFKNNHIVFNLVNEYIGLSAGKCPENVF